MTSAASLNGGKLFDLQGAVALVTGGGTGIGLMCARALAANGAKVYISGRRKQVVESTAAACNADLATLGGSLVPLVGDVSSKEDLAQIAAQIKQADGKLHILVNNAGVVGPETALAAPEKMTAEEVSAAHLSSESFSAWDQVFAINTHSLWFATMTLLPLLAAGNAAPPKNRTDAYAKWTASVINITSISGLVKIAQSHYAYNASKAAANSLTKMLAHELNFRSQLGVRVNAIAPGMFVTEMTTSKGTGARIDPSQTQVPHFNPAGRSGTEPEMGQLCLYLATNAFQNGAVIQLDGGFVASGL